jgi:iron complex outermembrane receptor protein
MSTLARKYTVRTLPLLLAAAYAGGAFAQSQIEEVIVTAQKRQEKLQDVPLSVTAISGAQLETRGIEGIANLNALAPNLMYRGNNTSSLISTVSMRGSVQGQPAIWVDAPVGMYVDGVYLGKTQGSVFDVVEVERIEVLRGPQGTLFGRNTEGGAINFVSRRPAGVWGGSVGLEVGNYGHAVERVALDLPKMGIASISLGVRKEDRDGVVKNPTGPDWGARDKTSYRLAATLDFTKDLKVDYTFDKSIANNTPPVNTLQSLSGWSGNVKSFWLPFAPFFGGTAVVTALGNAQYNAMLPYVWTASSAPSTMAVNSYAGLWERLNTEGHALTASYNVNDNNTLKYIFAKRKMHYNDRNNISGTPLNSVQVFPGFNWGMNMVYDRNTKYDQESHELQWIGNAGPVKYVLGAYWFKDDGVTLGAQDMGFFGTPYVRDDYAAKTENKALFGQVDYSVTERLTATLGMRHTKEDRSGWTNRFNTVGYDGPYKSSVFGPVNYSANFSGNSPMAALGYKLDDTTNLYGRVAKGWKSGGFNSELTSNSVLTPYQPQQSKSIELGVKKTFLNNRAQINAAVFRTKIDDQQLTSLKPASTESFLQNAGKSTYEGLELEGAIVPVDGWKIQASYGYLKTKFDQFMDGALNIPGKPIIDTASNRRAPWAPKHTLNLNVDGRLAKTAWGTLRGIVDYTYTADVYLYACNDSLTATNAGGSYLCSDVKMPATEMINARLLLAGVPIGGPGSADISLWVKNLTDQKRQTGGIDFGMLRTANWQEPRTYGVSLNYKW